MELGPSRFREPADPHIIYGKTQAIFVFIRSVLKEKYLNGSYEEDDSLQRTIWLASKDCLTSMIR